MYWFRIHMQTLWPDSHLDARARTRAERKRPKIGWRASTIAMATLLLLPQTHIAGSARVLSWREWWVGGLWSGGCCSSRRRDGAGRWCCSLRLWTRAASRRTPRRRRSQRCTRYSPPGAPDSRPPRPVRAGAAAASLTRASAWSSSARCASDASEGPPSRAAPNTDARRAFALHSIHN